MWKKLPQNQKEEYKKMILAFASLTEMFAQKKKSKGSSVLTPILNSKYQETVFQRVFNATAEDIGNTSYDVALEIGDVQYLVGIKTFGEESGDQKVAQFKSMQQEWSGLLEKIRNNALNSKGQKQSKADIDKQNSELYKDLAKLIAKTRNRRLKSHALRIQGFKEGRKVKSVYHFLMPSKEGNKPIISVGETSYDKIQIKKIKVEGCTSPDHPTNFTFHDNKHKYRYTAVDSQLYMDFGECEKLDAWDVDYAEDAYAIFANIANKVATQSNTVIESHCWKIDVQSYSGFNSFYGVGSKLGTSERGKRIQRIKSKFASNNTQRILSSVETDLNNFFSKSKRPEEKCKIRQELLKKTAKYPGLFEELKKILFRPKDEIYIPVHNSKKFHKQHPNFFGDGIGTLSFKKGDKDKTKFKMVLEPSKEEFYCYVTQEAGKAIESVDKQSILGEWLLRKVFQLDEYEPLTEKRLEELGINGIRFYKTNDKKIHMEFIWIDNENLPKDFWK